MLVFAFLAAVAVCFGLGAALLAQRRQLRALRAELRQLQEARERQRHSSKLEVLGRLDGGVAHDFNNLLTVTRGFSELLLRRLEPDSPHRPLVEEILKASQRTSGLTQQLLAFSRRQEPAPVVLDLNRLVMQIQPALGRLLGEDIELFLALDPELKPVRADPGQLDQVLLNLAANARDAMPAGGRLTLTTANRAAESGHPQLPAGNLVTLSVRDTGCGMDAATRARIFEPFFTTKAPGQGTGLGLALVQDIVRQAGGVIEADTAVGQGSTFTIYLPASSQPVEADTRVTLPADLPRGRETILLVEDEDQVRRLAWHVLEECGYTVLDARLGPEAAALCRSFPNPIHLLLSDVVMPGQSGPVLYEQLLPDRPGLRVVYLSGHPGNSQARLLDPSAPFLRKPFTPDQLARTVREVLDQS